MNLTRAEQESYEKLVEELAEECTCTPVSNRPCEGLLSGGLCDDLHMDRETIITDEEDDDCEPDEL